MNIFLREIKSNIKSLLIWSGIVLMISTVGFAKFSAYADNPDLLAILDNLPAAMLEAFNLNSFNLTTVTGFYGVMFAYFGLILSISAVMWGSDIISKEERDKTLEFSMSLPVSRGQVVWAKTAAVLFSSIVLALFTWGAIVVNAKQYQPDSKFYEFVALGSLALFIMQMIFLSIGILIACVVKQHKLSGSVAVSLLLGTYFISILSSLSDKLEFLKYFSPFTYFNAADFFRDAKFEPVFVWLSAGIIVIALAAGFFTYSKRDLYI
ncbi:MAG: ABC transporter permease subunit [Chloroflexi bacterium]|jgi:ABC-2 type transport system permease protein|nr:ABC transporter permease subunit [Chloroflexota bacterium]MBT3670257.1 ABC transporter permease subunit [Chloroflexota bacterium]MBT4003146.1 ABC transporter permease subunit [Chloroflexota bacterium]MBT4306070.1 ABC transporter permease subunit [Chloroflexota bacterium]MBT4534449.1 ABC transporter permease subunit [Chloroflexota bacterium]